MDNRTGKERKDPRAAIQRLLDRVVRNHEFGQISRKRIELDWRTGRELIRQIGLARSGRFTLDEGNEWVYAQLLMWVTGNPAMRCLEPFGMRRYVPADLRKGIYLCGPTGSGKSWATQIMAALAQAVEAGYTFGGREYFIHPTDVRADEICAHYRRTGDLQTYVEDPVLCVQDVGSEPVETLYMGNRVNVIKTLIEARGDRDDCMTIITSNLPMEGQVMMERYKDRALSRLAEMCNVLVLNGKDRRTGNVTGK